VLAACAICHCNHSECDEVELVWPRVLKTWRDVSKSRFPEVFFSVVDRGEVYDFGDSVQSGRAGFAGDKFSEMYSRAPFLNQNVLKGPQIMNTQSDIAIHTVSICPHSINQL